MQKGKNTESQYIFLIFTKPYHKNLSYIFREEFSFWIAFILLAIFGKPDAPVPPKIELMIKTLTSSPPLAVSMALYICDQKGSFSSEVVASMAAAPIFGLALKPSDKFCFFSSWLFKDSFT